MWAEHIYLLFQTRVSELRDKIHTFLLQPADLFTDHWLLIFLKVAETFLNQLNLKLEDQPGDVFQNWKHVPAFQKPLKLWLARLRHPDLKALSVSFFATTPHKKTIWHTQTSGLLRAHLLALSDNSDCKLPIERCFESSESLLELGLNYC